MSNVITGPGWYKTRDGRKVEISAKVRGEYWVGYFPCSKDHVTNRWSSDGSFCVDKTTDLSDIIAPWTDPEETVCVAVFRCGDNLLTKVIDADDSETTGEVGRAIVKLKGGA